MSALKWHLCERLWEIKSPIRIVTDSRTETWDESESELTADEDAYVGEDDGGRVERLPDSPPVTHLFWAS